MTKTLGRPTKDAEPPTTCAGYDIVNGQSQRCPEAATCRVVGYFLKGKNRDLLVCKEHGERHAGFPNFLPVKALTKRSESNGNQ